MGCSLALILGSQYSSAQGVPRSGVYQITEGRFIACCGIAGSFINKIPDQRQAFIALTLNPLQPGASMSILGPDQKTVFRLPASGPQSGFTYTFTNGVVFPNHIQFGDPFLPPWPDQPAFSVSVDVTEDTLTINGKVFLPCPGCADIPTEFTHTNVVAKLMPVAAARVSEMEICWTTATNRSYQIQYRSALTTNSWVNLGEPVAGTGAALCVPDKLPADQPQRYYRVLLVP